MAAMLKAMYPLRAKRRIVKVKGSLCPMTEGEKRNS